MHQLNLGFYFVFCLLFRSIHFSWAAGRDHPWADPQSCKLSSPGYVCDSKGKLRPEDLSLINKALLSFNNANQCGQCLAVAVQDYSSKPSVESYAKGLANDWKSGFPNCRSLAVMAYGTAANYIYWAAGEGSIMCNTYDDLFTNDVGNLFRKKQDGQAIEKMIDSFHNNYEARKSEGCEAKRCPRTGTLADFRQRLPDPFKTENQNVCGSIGPLCDPDNAGGPIFQVLNPSQRSALERALQESANSPCGACLVVGIIGQSLMGTNEDLTKVAINIRTYALWLMEILRYDKMNPSISRETWISTYTCNSVSVLLVNQVSSYATLMPHKNLPSCNRIGAVYDNNVQKFADGNIPGAIQSIAEGFNQVEKSSQQCRNDTCGNPASTGVLQTKSPTSQGIGGKVKDFIKNKGLGIFKKVDLKKILIPIAVVLLLIGVGICCGCIFCREKTTGCLQGIGSMATKHGPGLMSRFGGGGGGAQGGPSAGGGPTASYSKGPQRDEVGFGGTYGPDGGGMGGGGGSWNDDPNRDNKPQYDMGQGEGNRGWVGSKTMTGGGGGGW